MLVFDIKKIEPAYYPPKQVENYEWEILDCGCSGGLIWVDNPSTGGRNTGGSADLSRYGDAT